MKFLQLHQLFGRMKYWSYWAARSQKTKRAAELHTNSFCLARICAGRFLRVKVLFEDASSVTTGILRGHQTWQWKTLWMSFKTIINHPFVYGLYHPCMVILGMVYYCFNHIKCDSFDGKIMFALLYWGLYSPNQTIKWDSTMGIKMSLTIIEIKVWDYTIISYQYL